MADSALEGLNPATAPLAGDELIYGTQDGNSVRITVDEVRGPVLASLADLTLSQGDLLFVNGDGEIERLPKGTARQVLRQNGALTAPEWVDSTPVLLPAIATTSGTAKDVIDIPAWVKRITIGFSAVSTSGTATILLQIGDSGGLETTGYDSLTTGINASGISQAGQTDGFGIYNVSAGASFSGIVCLELMDPSDNRWVAQGALINTVGAALNIPVTGVKALSAPLDRLRLTTVGGVAAFDAGKISVSYE